MHTIAMILLDTLSIVLLGVVFVQDWRTRSVSLILYPLLVIVLALRGIGSMPFSDLLSHWGSNLLFVLCQLVLLTIYYSLKRGKPVFLMQGLIGWGDVLFWLVVSGCFSFVNFILYFLSSLLVSLVCHIIYMNIVKEKHRPMIPLAGLQATFLALLIGVRFFFPALDFYQDGWLIYQLI